MGAGPRKKMAATPDREPYPPSEGRFSRLYRDLTRRPCRVAEANGARGGDLAEVREKIVRCLWFDQFFDPGNLRAEDGRKLSVFFPGHWNEGAGPDFRNAEFAFAPEARVRGDVEVHVFASDWNRHRHAEDPAYERVGLHVVLRNDLGTPAVAHRVGAIPQLALEGQLGADLTQVLKSLDPDGYPRAGCGREGTCCRSLRACGRDEQWIGRFLDIAGDERILCKAARFEALLEQTTPDDALYEALMEAMGYSSNRRGFRLLAKSASLMQLRRLVPVDAEFDLRREIVEAILYGLAGFLDRKNLDRADQESETYLDSLIRHWRSVQPDLGGSRLDESVWNLKQTRPANHPMRRIAGISVFVASHLHTGFCRALLTAVERAPRGSGEAAQCRRTVETLHALFDEKPRDYWAQRTTFGPKCLARPTRLIGRGRTTKVIVNVVIPLFLALSRRDAAGHVEQRLHNVYASLKPGEDNAITRYMMTRIFGDAAAGRRVVRSLRRRQGLVQIFHDFCESDTVTCEDCGFLAAVEGRTD